MKITTALLFVVCLSFGIAGQARKPGKKPKPAPPPLINLRVVAPADLPTERVVVEKISGDRVSGFFVGGDAVSVTVETSGGRLRIPLSEIVRLQFDNTLTELKVPQYYEPVDPLRPIVPKKISGGVLNGKAVEMPSPEYPASARAVRASGAVNVQVTINEEGKVISASAVSGHPLLRQAAEQAARSAVFNPTSLSGQPVQVTGVLVYNFVP